jgi:O-antigen/teichoic acid export membrane protein
MNVLGAFTSALYPHLCEVRGNLKELKQRFFSSLKTTVMVMFPLIIAQSSLAPVYVPLVFGQKWISAIPILVIICLSALSYPLYSSTNSLLNAVNETPITLRFSLIYTMVFAIAILVVVKWGILWVAASVLACQLLLPPSYSIWAIRYVFAKHSSFSLSDEKS